MGYWGQANSDEGAFFNVIQVLGEKKLFLIPDTVTFIDVLLLKENIFNRGKTRERERGRL